MGWEGSRENQGTCYGSSSHVWNYAQAFAHLFPGLERSLRETEFGPTQNEEGHQFCRSAIPIRPLHQEHAHPDAADGQLGGIIKFYRDWRISGDTEWLRRWWPKIRKSLDYCIRTWDPGQKGMLEEPHINTYDIQFWGADSMCMSIYLGALKAATGMGEALGENVERYSMLLAKVSHQLEEQLFNGDYFYQKTAWRNLQANYPRVDDDSPNYPEFLSWRKQTAPPINTARGVCLTACSGVAFLSVRRGPGARRAESRKSSSCGSPVQSEERVLRTSECKAALLRVGQRIRIAVLHLASRRSTCIGHDLLGRSLDGGGVRGGFAPDCNRKD